METLTLNLDQIYDQIKERAIIEGAFTHEEWDGIVDEVISSKREFEETSDDVDWSEIRETMRDRFDDFEVDMPEM